LFHEQPFRFKQRAAILSVYSFPQDENQTQKIKSKYRNMLYFVGK